MKPSEIFAVAFMVTIVFVLVRPNSKAAEFVQAVGKFGRALVVAATDTATPKRGG